MEVATVTAKLDQLPGIDIKPQHLGARQDAGCPDEESGDENKTIETDRLIEMIRNRGRQGSWRRGQQEHDRRQGARSSSSRRPRTKRAMSTF